MKNIFIDELSENPSINICLDTIKIGKQALVFCNTRRSAEATAEKISMHIKESSHELEELSSKILKVLSSPTKQCKRLAQCIKKGIAFHHAGLASEQRKLVEDNFRKGSIKVICSTPTLAFGLNLPAYRVIIKDLKRYSGRRGLKYIPVLEYLQMAGRAGRPDFNDEHGEAICIAKTRSEAEEIIERYINAGPESIVSKLAVEPVLRTHCLSLIVSGFSRSKKDLIMFFEKTFYGRQYGSMRDLEIIITRILGYLEECGFIETRGIKENKKDINDKNNNTGFVDSWTLLKKKTSIKATFLGERVSQLYLDPYTADFIIKALKRASQKKTTDYSFLQMACSTLELRPLASVRSSEAEKIEAWINKASDELIVYVPSMFEFEYDEFIKSVKTSLALKAWMDEEDENSILEKYNIAPGELHVKRSLCDWILYSSEELARLIGLNNLINQIRKTRKRLDKGVKEELIPLVRLKNIGRQRARKLYRNGIRDIGGIKKADISLLGQLLGKNIAASLKSQVGDEIKKISSGKRKGQTSISKYHG